MKKITLLGLLFLLTAQFSFSQDTYKRITINNANHQVLHRLIAEGIDLRCGADSHDDGSVTLELGQHELDVLKRHGVNYKVEVEDLSKFYQDRINATRAQAHSDYLLEQSRAALATAQRSSNSSTTIDNFMEYVGCDEIDWAQPVNFPDPSTLTMGGCLTIDQVEAQLDAMRAYSVTNTLDIVSVKQDASPTNQTTWGNPASSITNNGLTYTGQGTTRWDPKTMYYIRITGNEGSTAEGTRPQILFTSMIHSREVGSLMSNIYFMWYLIENYNTNPAVQNLVDNNELYFIPVVNPDGLRWNEHVSPTGGAFQRKNLRPNTGGTGNTSTNRGVDLNRNFDYFWGTAGSGSSGTPTSDSYRGPSAASEPETQILVDFILARNFETCIMNHTTANGIPHPYGGNPTFVSGREDEMHKWHEDMTRYNRYVSGARIFSAANGIADDWMVGGAADTNGSTGSGQSILATTPEHGDTGFWPPITDIVPIAKRSMRISFMTAYYGGRYAKFHDLTQSDITSLTSDLTFGIERLGQTASNFTLTVTPVSSNIVSITSPPVQTGMTILEQRDVTASMTLNASIQPNDKIEYRVQLSDGGSNIFYDANFEKYYQPSLLLNDDPDTDLLTNWTTTGTWTASTASGAGYSGTRGIKQGGNAVTSYGNNTTAVLTSAASYDFSNASEIIVQFYTKWDLERNYDFVEIEGSTNGTTWQSLCGKYNKPNSTSSTNSAHALKGSSSTFQSSNSSGRVYDGDRFDNWVMEEIVIDASNNSFLQGATNAQFRFRFRSDGNNQTENYSTTRDGFFIDDFKIIEIQIPCDDTNPPTNLTVDTVTPASASVSWDNIPSATYDLRYREVGAPSWNEVTNITTNTYNILGLTPGTDYEVQVRTRCSTTTSAYSASENFTTPSAVACTGGSVNTFPYTEGFETGIGLWSQSANGSVDDIDWTRDDNGTPSTNTGPGSASEGTFYMYTEASTNVSPPGNPNMTAYLTSPCIDFSGRENAQIQFDYHMFGADMGTLSLEVSTDNGANYTSLFSISGEQQGSTGAAWTTQAVDLSLYDGQTIKLRFNGLTGTGFNSDMAIDAINVTSDEVVLSAPPVAVCQDITVQLDGTGNATIIPSQIDNGSSDDVGITSFSLDIDTFNCTNIGTPVVVTLTVEDADGQTDTCTANVTVEDNVNPVVDVINLPDITDQCSVTSLTPPTATDNCDGTINGTSPATASLPITSSTTITWTYTDSEGNSVQQTQDIVIGPDTTNPVADVTNLPDINAQCSVTSLTPPTATDNCDGTINGTSPATASLPITASTTITWTYTDAAGNSVQQTQDIVIDDTTNPVADVTNLPDINAQCSVTSLTPPTATDNCDGTINGTSPATASLPITASTTITWTYTDAAGNSVQQTQDIVIDDTTNPVADVTNLPDINAQCSVTSLTPPTATDNCDGTINGTSPATASLPITASTTITWTYTDAAGNSVQQTQDIVIDDTTNPVADVTNLPDINAQCSVTSLTPPTATDNCDGTINGTSPATASLPITSSTTITWTYTDAAGNSVQQTQDIVIDDTTNPVADVTNLPDINAQCSVTSLTPPTATDNCDGTINGTSPATASLPITASTTITWTYTDAAGNSVQQTQDIVIDDTTNPVADVTNLPDINAQCSVTSLTPPTATDNCDGTINGTSSATASLPITSSTTITWTYTDAAGNSVQQTQDIVIDDTTNPVADVTNLPDINAQCSVTSLTPPTATDNCDGTINGTSPATASLPITSSTTITWTYTDAAGNSVQQTQDIVIDDTTNPVADVTNLPDINAQCSVTSLTPPTATDNCDGTINGTSPATASLPITSSTTITWTYTDAAGNSVQQTQDIVIDDTTNPVADVTNLPDINAQCSVTSLTPPTATDNCDGTINGTSPATASLPITSSTTITWTYTDAAGNSVQQTQDIVIDDTTNPVADVTNLPDINAQCSVTSLTPPTATDNCDGTINGTSPATASLPITSSTTITWTYTDAAGNSVQQTQDIVIDDTTNPVADVTNLPDINAQCSVTSLTPPTATDNCDGTINGTSPATASLPITSSTTITWTYTDAAGNSVQQTQDIVIDDTTNPVADVTNLPDINAQCSVTSLTPPTATDNCDGTINGTSPATASLPITSSTTITWTYTDAAGNSVQQTQDIVIDDTTNPVADVTNLPDINAQCSVTSLTPPTATDNCDGTINGTSPATASLPITSSTTITWTYTDAAGNSVQQTQDIVIDDTTNPVADVTNLPDINAQCSVTSLTPPTATDNCDGTINGTSPATASLPITASTTITWTYTDAAGNSVQQTQDIVIDDTTNPVADVTNLPDINAQCSVTSLTPPTATDNCDGTINGTSPATASLPITASTTITWTYTDAAGNSVQQTQDIVIDDTTNPVADVTNLPDINAQCSVTSLTPPTATDNCDGTINGTSPATASLPITSSTTITWTYTDAAGNSVQQTQDIVIDDTTNPVADVTNLPDINAQCSVTSLTPPTATDNCDGTINGTSPATASLPITASTTITWTYTDAAGNSVQQTQDIVIDDTTNPVADVTNLPDINAQCSVTSLTPPTATDNCDGTINGTSPATASLPITASTTITWTYTDAAGNSVQQTQDIVIDDTTNPVADVTNLPDINAQCSVTSLTPPTATDNCDGTINGTSPATASLPITTSTTITWTYTDAAGNSVQQTQDIVIDDTTNPVADVTNLPDINAQCSVTSLTPPTATDNCDGTINGTSPATASLPITASTTITWTYTDAAGNSVQQTQDIVIDDTIDPVCVTQDISVELDMTGNATITAGQIDNGSSDNCGIASISVSPSSFTTLDIGDNTVTLTVTDTNGNTTDCTATVTITNNTLDVDDFDEKDVSIRPNPFNTQIIVELPTSLIGSEMTIRIFDLNGRIVYNRVHISNNEGNIVINDLDDLEQAPYFIRLTDRSNGISVMKKLIKF